MMRTITRTTAKVPTLFSEQGSGWKRAKANKEKYQRGQIQINQKGSNNLSFSGSEHWKKPDVRGALHAQQGKVCAYCGCLLPRNDRGDVEHFRPKKRVDEDTSHGGYWWLAYDFDNYVLSCRICNSYRKGSKFPLRARARRITYSNNHHLSREARRFLDATADPIEELVRVEWQDGSCLLFPVDGITRTQRTQVKAMIECFRLNLDSRLVRERIEIADKVVKLIDEGKPDGAGEFAIRYRPHSLVARQILLDTNRAHYLPAPSAEFQWLFGDLIADLDQVLKFLEHNPDDDILLSEADELLWSIAIWVAAPPNGTPADLIGQLAQYGLREKIDRRVQLLV